MPVDLQDEDLDSDTEDDKQDLILSKAYLRAAKSQNQESYQSATVIKESVERMKLYLQHFFGSESVEQTSSGPTKSKLNLKFPKKLLTLYDESLFQLSEFLAQFATS